MESRQQCVETYSSDADFEANKPPQFILVQMVQFALFLTRNFFVLPALTQLATWVYAFNYIYFVETQQLFIVEEN